MHYHRLYCLSSFELVVDLTPCKSLSMKKEYVNCLTIQITQHKETMINFFDHEKLDVYKLTIGFIISASEITAQLPRGKAYLTDQLQRASSSILLNIAEGAGEYATNEKARFYRMARRSATECASILDICYMLQLIEEGQYSTAREMLLRIVSMLTKLATSQFK